MGNKRITLHPIKEDGTIDANTNLYPKTVFAQVEGGEEKLDQKQDALVSGENIKTINGTSILGGGNIEISTEGTIAVDSALSPTSENPVQNKVIYGALQDKLEGVSLGGIPLVVANKTVNIPLASSLQNGAMSKEDYAKLSNINLSNYVTYTNATSDLDLGQYGLVLGNALIKYNAYGIDALTIQGAGTEGIYLVSDSGEHSWLLIRQDGIFYDDDGTDRNQILAVKGDIPTAISDLTNDLTSNDIPDLSASKITSGTFGDDRIANASTWNGKQDKLTAGSNISIVGNTISSSYQNTTYTLNVSMSASTYVLTISLTSNTGAEQIKTVDLPLETMVVSGSYDDQNQKLVLELKNGEEIEIPIGDLVDGLASTSTSISSSSHGVALGGTIGSPTITVTSGSVASNNGSVVTGGVVYNALNNLARVNGNNLLNGGNINITGGSIPNFDIENDNASILYDILNLVAPNEKSGIVSIYSLNYPNFTGLWAVYMIYNSTQGIITYRLKMQCLSSLYYLSETNVLSGATITPLYNTLKEMPDKTWVENALVDYALKSNVQQYVTVDSFTDETLTIEEIFKDSNYSYSKLYKVTYKNASNTSSELYIRTSFTASTQENIIDPIIYNSDFTKFYNLSSVARNMTLNSLMQAISDVWSNEYHQSDLSIITDGSLKGCINSKKDILLNDKKWHFSNDGSGFAQYSNVELVDLSGTYYNRTTILYINKQTWQVNFYSSDVQITV